MPGDSDDLGIEVINVHAPSGTPKLTDPQRRTLFLNLLQSSSKVPEPATEQFRLQDSRPIKIRPTGFKTIGEVKFIIGGDTNTSELFLSTILNDLRDKGNLKVSFEVMRPTWGMHGDMCVVGGCNKDNTKIATGKAKNHDPQHVPYGIWWSSQSEHATEQLTPISQVKAGSTSQSSSWPHQRNPYMPAMPQQAVPLPESWESHATEQPQLDEERTSPEGQASLHDAYAEQTAGRATEQPLPDTEASLHDADPEQTTGHATEQPQPDTEDIPTLDKPEQELAYVIVNTFLDNPTLQSTDAEKIIKRVIVEQKQWGAEVLDSIDEVFRPVFVEYTNGTKDKTRWTARDPAPYIREWRNTAEWRDVLQAGANAEGKQFSREEVAPIVYYIVKDFIVNHADDAQKMDKRGRNKSRAEARLNRLCGSRHVANAIWQLGLPKVLAPYTTRVHRTAAMIETDTADVLQWLAKLAEVIQSHKATPEYQENTRKSGDSHGKSGLDPAEMDERIGRKIGRDGKNWTKKWSQ